MTFVPERVRPDFPPLRDGRLVYFDSACMSLRPTVVIDALAAYHAEYPACGERSLHRLGRRVDEEVGLAREAARRLLHARHRDEIVFTPNTTYGINLIAHSFPFAPGDTVVTSDQEHNSNLLPWLALARHGVRHRAVPLGDVDALCRALTSDVKLVAMVATSNLDGASIDVPAVVEIAHRSDVPVLLDAAQMVPHRPVDVRAFDVDFLVCSGHKMLAPSGTGILYGKREWLARLRPTLVGGGTVVTSTLEGATYLDGPERFEAGLQNYGGIVGLRHAIEYLEGIGLEAVSEHERRLTIALDAGLRRVPGVTVLGPPPQRRGGITSFTVAGADVHQVCLLLDESAGIAVRSGQHCVHSWFNAHGVAGTVRVSLYLYNTPGEVASFVDALEQVRRVLA